MSDKAGCQFWRNHFLKREEIPWSEFVSLFLKFVPIPENESQELNLRCLHDVLAEMPKAEGATSEVVNIEQFGKILDWFGPLETIGDNNNQNVSKPGIYDRIRKLLMKSWFHGEISTAEAQLRLSGLPGGTFLVRFSSTQPGWYTISSLTQANTSIKHQRVSYIGERGFNFNGEWYQSLEDIIRDSDNLFIPCPGSRFQSLFCDQPHSIIGYT